jgi:protein TonB
MQGQAHNCRAARRDRRLGEAAAFAVTLHLLVLGGYGQFVRLTVPPAAVEIDDIDVDTLDEAASRALMDTLAPLPGDEPAPLAPPPWVAVDQKGDGQKPTVPTPYIAEQDANPAVERRRITRTPAIVQPANPPGRLAALGPAHRASSKHEGTSSGAGPAVVVPERSGDLRDEGDAVPAPLAAEGTLSPGPSPAFGAAAPQAAPPRDPTPVPPAPQPADPRPAELLGGVVTDDVTAAEPGDTAMVRARKSVLAAFILQVQHRVRERWNPKEAYRRADPTMHSLTNGGRRTALELRVRSDGHLESARVAAPSGMAELDEEALAACERAQPFAPPPPEVLDPSGCLVFTFGFELDMVDAAYRADLSKALLAEWHPSRAFRVFSGADRMTTVRVLLTFEGVLVHAAVLASSGLDVLDQNVLATLRQGLRLPRPPPTLGEVAGLVPLRLVFMHNVRGANDVKVVRDLAAGR